MNREEWLRWRKFGIGASDCPIIMGDSPYSNLLELYLDKTSDEVKEKSNYIMELGNQLEPIARARYELLDDGEYPPANFIHALKPYYRCSLDGYNADKNKAIEIKYCGKVFKEEVPLKYRAQLQWQYAVTLCESLDYVQINNMNRVSVMAVEKDDEYISRLIDKVDWFWECVLNRRLEEVEQANAFLYPKRDKRTRTGSDSHSFKTHCKQGHVFEGENLFIAANGQRRCRTCIQVAAKKSRANVNKKRRAQGGMF